MARTFRVASVALLTLSFAFFFGPSANAATLTLSAATTSLAVGATTTVSVIVRSPDQAMNVSQGKVNFPTDKLQVTGISKGSLLTYWTAEPAYSNSNGTVTFGGGLPTPGYKGTGRSLITITFRAKSTGKATVTYASGTVLANDGLGTNILTGYGSTTLNIAAAAAPSSTPTATPSTPAAPSSPGFATPIVRSTSHPDQNAWYNLPNVVVAWTRPTDMQGVSYTFDQNATNTPDETQDENAGTKTYSGTPDGTWYFHLRAKYGAGWSSTAHVRVQLDTLPPESFVPKVTALGTATPNSYQLVFQTTDRGSGVEKYQLALDTQEFRTVKSPHVANVQKGGIHQFTLRAVDRAGNVREAVGQFNVEGSPAPRLTSVPKKVTLFGNFTVEGLTVNGDNVVLQIDGKEVARFVSDIYRIEATPGIFIPDGHTLWRYSFKPFLVPGAHTLTATAINLVGIESPTSVPAEFRTLTSTVQLFGFLVPSAGLVIILLTIIMLLLALMVVLLERFRRWRQAEALALVAAEQDIDQEIEHLQSSLEQDLAGKVQPKSTKPTNQTSMQEQVRHDIQHARKRIDDVIDREVEKVKKPKRQK